MRSAPVVAGLVFVESAFLVAIGIALLVGGEVKEREVRLAIVLLQFVAGASGVPIGVGIWRGRYWWRRAGSAWLVGVGVLAFVSPFVALPVVAVIANALALRDLLPSLPLSTSIPPVLGAPAETETIVAQAAQGRLVRWLEAALTSSLILAWVLVRGGGDSPSVNENWIPALGIFSIPYGVTLIYLLARARSLQAHYLGAGAAAGGVPVLAMMSASGLTWGWGIWLLALLQLPVVWVGIKSVYLLPDAPRNRLRLAWGVLTGAIFTAIFSFIGGGLLINFGE